MSVIENVQKSSFGITSQYHGDSLSFDLHDYQAFSHGVPTIRVYHGLRRQLAQRFQTSTKMTADSI